MHVALYHYSRSGGDLDVWHVLLNNIPYHPVQRRFEILDGDVHRSVFRNCGKYRALAISSCMNILITTKPAVELRLSAGCCLLDRATFECEVNELLTYQNTTEM